MSLINNRGILWFSLWSSGVGVSDSDTSYEDNGTCLRKQIYFTVAKLFLHFLMKIPPGRMVLFKRRHHNEGTENFLIRIVRCLLSTHKDDWKLLSVSRPYKFQIPICCLRYSGTEKHTNLITIFRYLWRAFINFSYFVIAPRQWYWFQQNIRNIFIIFNEKMENIIERNKYWYPSSFLIMIFAR